MNNFLKFIEEDIEAKKTLITTLPTNSKPNIKKFNIKVEEIQNKYNAYRTSVKKYIEAKQKALDVKQTKKNLEELSSNVVTLERARFVLNPQNTFYEKIGFDNLVYQLSNYSDFQFDIVNKIINGFLSKFELVGIRLNTKDFDYTCYVKEYMEAYLKIKDKKSSKYKDVSKVFEKIYWVNPEIIQHIEINFRKLIKKHTKKFEQYINKLQKETKEKCKIKNYEECMHKLKEAYILLNEAEEENISDIVNLAKNGSIDINHYLPDNKVRTDIYSDIAIDSLKFDDVGEMDNFYDNIYKLKKNIDEYNNYIQFIPLIQNFKKNYEKRISTGDKDQKKLLRESEKEINEKEKMLFKLNTKIYDRKFNIIKKVSKEEIKILKLRSVTLAKELYELYKKYDKTYFESKVLPNLNKSFTIADLLNLYYSFDYFKKSAIKKVFELTNYNELLNVADEFDLFAMNPTNVIMNGVLIFDESDVAKIIVNKYRLSNINITLDDLNTDDLGPFLEKLNLLLRVKKIEGSKTSVEKIWFLVKAQLINSEED